MKSDLTKQKIIERSLEIFVKKGYGNVTVRELAKYTGVSTGLLFHYFPGKQALLELHLQIAMSGLQSAIELLKQDVAPIQAFESAANLTLSSLKQSVPRNLYVLMNQPLPAEVLPTNFLHARQQILDESVLVIKKGQIAGQIKTGDPVELALLFWGAIQGSAQILASQPNLPAPSTGLVIEILKK